MFLAPFEGVEALRIAVISSQVFKLGGAGLAGYGGLEQVAWMRAKGLAELGHQVALVAPHGSECPGVEVIECGPAGQWDEKRGFDLYWQRLFNFDAIVDDSWMKHAYMLKAEGVLKNRETGRDIPVLGVMHAPVLGMYGWLPPVDKPCMVCISKDQANHFEALHGREARVCYNGVDPEMYKPLGIPRTDRFLFCGRFSSIKGPDIAIRACKEAGVCLDVIGDRSITQEPELYDQCCKEADGERIRIIGPQTRGAVVWWMSQAHAFIHSAFPFREPFGLAPVEAMLCFPKNVNVRATQIERLYSHPYTGSLLRLTTDRGMVECTPEHPFMTQGGWVKACSLTLDDSLLWDKHYDAVDTRRIGDLVEGLFKSGAKNSSPEARTPSILHQIQGKEAAFATGQPEILLPRGRNLYPEMVSEERLPVRCGEIGETSGIGDEEGSLHGSGVRPPSCSVYERGDKEDKGGLFRDGSGESRNGFESNSRVHPDEGQVYGGATKAIASDQVPYGGDDFGGTCISGGDHRRGGVHISEESGEKKERSCNQDWEYVGGIDPMDSGKDSNAQCPDFQEGGERKSVGLLGAFDQGIELSPSLRSTAPVLGYQEASNGNGYRMDSDSIRAGQDTLPIREEGRSETNDPVYELTRIQAISQREVSNLQVYNLGTRTGTYQANGFLVHNCGLPVIASDNGALRETVKQSVGMVLKSEKELVVAIKSLAGGISEDCRNECREHAKQFSPQAMAKRYEQLCQEAMEEGW